MRSKFHFKPESGFTEDNGYVKEVKELGEKMEIELEKLGYQITIPSFTDWGYVFNATLKAKTVCVIIEIENLDQGSFELAFKPEKKWYQALSSFDSVIRPLQSQIKYLDLKMNFK